MWSSLQHVSKYGHKYEHEKKSVWLTILMQTHLSCAHDTDCFTDRYGNKVKLDWLDIGRNDLSIDAGVVRVYLQKSDIWRNVHYNPTTGENDLALIFLSVSTDIEPVMLNDEDDIPRVTGAPLEVSGWGLTNLGQTGYFSERPRVATVGYLPNSECSNTAGFPSDRMCAISKTDELKGPCTGDSVRVQRTTFLLLYTIYNDMVNPTLYCPAMFTTRNNTGRPVNCKGWR